MPNPYSVRFLNGLQPAGAGTPYTVPAGYVAIVSSISISTGGTGPIGAQLYIGASPCYQIGSLAANSFAQWNGHQVANPGENITSYCTGGTAYFLVSGYLLTQLSP
jgi:hypothetical protein